MQNKWLALALICIFDFIFLLYCVSTISISHYEANIYFNDNGIMGSIVRASCAVFGQNDYALRLPMMSFHLISVVLLYKVSKFYLKFQQDRIIATIAFVLMPGSIVSGIVVNSAGLCIMLTLLSLYLFHTRQKIAFYVLLVSLVFINSSFLVFYLALFIFGIYKKDPTLSWISAILFSICLYFFGFDTGGRPKGYFVDTFGIFAAVFSPPMFIFFVYTIYRIWIKESSKDMLWFVCITAFCFCMLLSIRQRLELENFLPFCIIATPLILRVFLNSYRIRLPQFRKRYNYLAVFLIMFLSFNYLLIIFNPILYKFIDEPKKHFAYKFHIAKELSKELKRLNISGIKTDQKLENVLKFYGISDNKDYILDNGSKIKIKKFGKLIAQFDIKTRS